MGNSWKGPKRYKIYTLAKKVRNNDDVADIIKKYAQSGKIKRVVDIRVPLNLNNYQSPVNSLETTKEFIESLGLEYDCNTPFEIHPTYSLNAYNGLINKNGIDCVIDTRTIETIQEQESVEESLDDYIKTLNENAEYKY